MSYATLAEVSALRSENTRLKARIEELERENFALAATQCTTPAGTEYGHFYCTRIDELEAALRFYADPVTWKKQHPEDAVSIPDFYSECAFGDTAAAALQARAGK